MTRFALIGTVLLFTLGTGCGDKQNPAGDFRHDASAPPAGDAGGPSYAKTIAPMMAASCTLSGCHEGDYPAAGIGLDRYENVAANAEASNRAIQDQSMPIGAGAALTATDRQSFQAWVNAGAPNN
jgi:uncharacterized membrane protein